MREFKWHFCRWSSHPLGFSIAEWEKLMSCCPLCDAEHPDFQGYLSAKGTEASAPVCFEVGENVWVNADGICVMGIITQMRAESVEVEYFSRSLGRVVCRTYAVGQVESVAELSWEDALTEETLLNER